MDPEAAASMMDTMGTESALASLGGEQLGGMLGAMDANQMSDAFTAEDLTEAAGKMEHDHVQGMDGESAAALLEGVITVMEPGELGNKGSAVDAGLVAAMLGAMDSSQVQDAITPERQAWPE